MPLEDILPFIGYTKDFLSFPSKVKGYFKTQRRASKRRSHMELVEEGIEEVKAKDIKIVSGQKDLEMDVELKVTPKNMNNSDIKSMRRQSKMVSLNND